MSGNIERAGSDTVRPTSSHNRAVHHFRNRKAGAGKSLGSDPGRHPESTRGGERTFRVGTNKCGTD